MPSPNITQTLSANGAKVILGVSDLDSVAVQVTGTFTATLEFEVSLDGRTFVSLSMTPSSSTTTATNTTTTGVWMADIPGVVNFQVRVSSYTSGGAVVTIQGQGE